MISTRPVIERIIQTLFERLNVMTTGIYPNSPVVEVLRPVRTESFSPKHFQLILIQGEQERIDELSKNGNPPSVAFMQTMHVAAHVMPSETDSTPFDEYCNTFYADIVECITNSGDSSWWRFGDLAINSEIGPMQPMESDGGVDGFIMPIEITYRVSESSPYEPRY